MSDQQSHAASVAEREQRLLDAIHEAVSWSYVEGEEARLRSRVALKEAAGWPLMEGEYDRLREIEEAKRRV